MQYYNNIKIIICVKARVRTRTEKFKYLIIIGENWNETEHGRWRRWHAPQGHRRRPIDRVARDTPINPPLLYIFITVGVQFQLTRWVRVQWVVWGGGLRSATRVTSAIAGAWRLAWKIGFVTMWPTTGRLSCD